MIELRIDGSSIDRVTADLEATAREAELALRSTVNRSTRWLGTQIRRKLARDVGVPQRVLRRRLVQGRVRVRNGQLQVEIWIGINPIDLVDLSPRQNSRGVRTRVGTQAGAFIRSPRGREGVFKREGRARLPLDRLSHPIDDQAVASIQSAAAGADFQSYVLRTYERELLWRLSTRR